MFHSFFWTAASGFWALPGNWNDVTAQQNPALVAPGSADVALLIEANPLLFDLLGGPAAATVFNTSGRLAFYGPSNFTTFYNNFTIDVMPGASMVAGSMSVTDSVVVTGAGASLVAQQLNLTRLTASNHAAVRLGSVSFYSVSAGGLVNQISIDPTASVEIGAAGGAASGALTVDAGQTATLPALAAGTLVDNGLVTLTGDLGFPVLGTGTIAMTDGAVTVALPAAMTLAVGGGTIALPAAGTAATLTGFVAGTAQQTTASSAGGAPLGTTLTLPRTDATGAVYVATGGGLGTLALTAVSGATLQTLTLAGTYAGDSFVVLPQLAAGTEQVIAVTGTIGTTTVGFISLFGPAVIGGVYTGSTITVGGIAPAPVTGVVDVLPGATLIADSLVAPAGTLLVGGSGARISAGTLSLGSSSGFSSVGIPASLTLAGGASGQVGTGMSLNSVTTVVAVDGLSSLEVGTTGGAAAGRLTIDRAMAVSGIGTLFGAVTNNGRILAARGPLQAFGAQVQPNALTVAGAIAGVGVLQIAANSDLVLQGAVGAGQTIAFQGVAATLDLSAMPAVAAAVTGFGAGDVILAAPAVAQASFAGGTLSLLNAAGATLEALTLAGSYPGSFVVTPGLAGGPAAVVAGAGNFLVGPAPTPAPGTDAADMYSFAAAGGDWGTAANWVDTSVGPGPAAVAPGGNDIVTITTPTQGESAMPRIVSGSGNAASLSMESTVLSGLFSALTVTITAYYGPLVSTLVNHAGLLSLTALVEGHLVVDNAAFIVAGAVQFYGPVTLDVVRGGAVSMASVAADTSGTGATKRLSVDATSAIEIGHRATAAPGALTVDQGATLSGIGVIAAPVINNGQITNVATIEGAVTGSGHLQVPANATLTVGGVIGHQQTIDFLGANAKMVMGSTSFPDYLSGFAVDDVLDITGTPIDSARYVQAAAGIGTLFLSRDGVQVQALTLVGNYAGTTFLANPDPVAGTDIVLVTPTNNVPCFAAGTRIRTARGDIAVEALRPGDALVTAFGGTVKLRWLGHRHVACTTHPRPQDVWPVRVRAGAFGPGLPARDLRLSPDHAVFADGVLVPVRYLVNGRSLRQEPVAAVTYYHVELPAHDVVLAEGLPCESYLDTGNRGAFADGGAATLLHADFARGVWEAEACAPLVIAGPRLAALRRRLLARAIVTGDRLSPAPRLRALADGRPLTAEPAGLRWQLRLPPGTRTLRLLSRVWVPAQTDPTSGDTRSLGVALSNLRLDDQPLDLADPRLGDGWHPPEPEWRWTAGDARIAVAGGRMLQFELATGGRYWADPPAGDRRRSNHSD